MFVGDLLNMERTDRWIDGALPCCRRVNICEHMLVKEVIITEQRLPLFAIDNERRHG